MKTLVGYRTASYSLGNLKAICPERGEVDTTLQSIHSAEGGLMLETSELNAVRNAQQNDAGLVLTYTYVGSSEVPTESQVRVDKARLDAVRFLDFELQEKYGHLFDSSLADERRASMRKECLRDSEPPKKYMVLRAMDSDSKHLLAMDYCYLADSFAVNSLAKRVLRLYENDDLPRTAAEKALLNTLNHAVTCALYNGSPQHVTCAVVSNDKLYRARNHGEFFYDDEKPVKVQSLLLIDTNGNVTQPVKEHDLESSRQFS